MQCVINKEQWVGIFREAGWDDAQMWQWHRVFEARHPEGHQKFLEWLGLPAEEIASIRSKSQ